MRFCWWPGNDLLPDAVKAPEMVTILQTRFADTFFSHFLQIPLIFLLGSTCQESIGSGNDLVPRKWQAITWPNNDPLHWRIYVYASPDYNGGYANTIQMPVEPDRMLD